MQAASVAYRTYALDLFGFGDSAKNTHFYSLDQQVNLLDQFLQELGIGKIALIGHGLGGAVALMFASRFPRLVDRMMVIGLPNGGQAINPRLCSAQPSELAEWLLGKSSMSEAAQVEAPKADPRAIQATVSAWRELDHAWMVQALRTPCLMVYGQNDPVVEGPLGQESNGSLPENIHQIVFEGSGHFPMLDEASKFNRLMTDFLALGSGTSPRMLQLKEEWKRRVR
jgi:pimeloyl-ACP methyl ester carboxylesterase